MNRIASAIGSGVLACVILASLAELADATTMSGAEIRTTVTDKTIFLKVPRRGEFPLYYGSNGHVTGDGSGFGLVRFFAPKETGKWWIAGNRVCQQWPTWYQGRRFCFSLAPINADTFKWTREDGLSGTARVGG